MIRDIFANEVEDEVIGTDLGQIFSFNDDEYRFVCRTNKSDPPLMTIDYSVDQVKNLVRGALATNLSITRDANVQDYRGERFYFETFTYRFVDIAQHLQLTVTPRHLLPDDIAPLPVLLILTSVFDLNATIATFKKIYISVVINL